MSQWVNDRLSAIAQCHCLAEGSTQQTIGGCARLAILRATAVSWGAGPIDIVDRRGDDGYS